eukprot:CAMPEP_0196718310 /NCGR_PEP_ID=MMETSP1091-20130531/1537_1 /TAXON_ID=302021 /ORGANISM="Rhodomonas sp., Strain CCMP768" /LENGTH=149 /DNA_ID=CAMNT_0042058931 /DNA_START=35 /DNA_END=484 /DNA_ORIENTATION=-
MSSRNVFKVSADQEEQQCVLDALDIFPKDEQLVEEPKGFRKLKKSHTESFKELVQSGANSPMFAVKKDKNFLQNKLNRGGNRSTLEAPPSEKAEVQQEVAHTDAEIAAIMKKLEGTDIQCWRTQSTDSTESAEREETRENEINDLIMSF